MFTTPFTFMNQAGGGGTLSCVVQCFTTNGTWSCCPGTVCIEVVAVGAGGNGANGGATPTAGSNKASTGGGGGGGGGVSICVITSGFGSSQCVIVGSTDSCFGTLVTATKGSNGCAAISNTTVSPEISTGFAPGGIGNYACGGAGGSSCTAAGDVSAFSGGSCATAPGGGGGGGQTYVTAGGTYYGGFAGGGGSSSTLCGITLGSGGKGGQGFYCIPPSGVTPNCQPAAGASYGGGGGGGAAGARSASQSGCLGAPGIIKVTQYILS